MDNEPFTLAGTYVRLEPLAPAHEVALREVVRDGELWNLRVTFVPHPSDIPQFMSNARTAFTAGHEVPFATIDVATNQVVGSTRFMKIDRPNRRAEIGFTFIARSWQRTHVNTEAKLLMLRHAFNEWQFNRIELITDVLNDRSRRAIERLGALQEGILRSHMVMPDGRIRDSALYSITRADWPGVESALVRKLAR